MKQHITVEQLNELSDTGRESYRKWLKQTYNTVPAIGSDGETMLGLLLSIGQMIEFLDEYSKKSWRIDTVYHDFETCTEVCRGEFEYEIRWDDDKGRAGNVAENEELCDALWEACKESLNEITIDS